jgi:hypothetical protein
MQLRIFIAITILFSFTGCAGQYPNPGERTADIFWSRYEHQKALDIIKPKAEQGIPWAQLRLGVAYEYGKGVEQNTTEALKWYKKAAAQKGEGKWADGQLVGATGEPGYFNQNSNAMVAQYQIANIYYSGKRVPIDLTKAYLWAQYVFNSSAGKDVFYCCEFEGGRWIKQLQISKLLLKIESELSPKQKEEAAAIFQSWAPSSK